MASRRKMGQREREDRILAIAMILPAWLIISLVSLYPLLSLSGSAFTIGIYCARMIATSLVGLGELSLCLARPTLPGEFTHHGHLHDLCRGRGDLPGDWHRPAVEP